ncbi:hypothetical protein Tcan_08259 [Toxocara canis]|uniref:Uncharacterized protein n=1 Tax=Toxocara canis TaxID=6265 RepID=A0A0B2V500_TOXCA|nr:hypothetical protein Tcan_08259 [Toxocara canis]
MSHVQHDKPYQTVFWVATETITLPKSTTYTCSWLLVTALVYQHPKMKLAANWIEEEMDFHTDPTGGQLIKALTNSSLLQN